MTKLFKLTYETYVYSNSLEEAVKLGNKLTENSCGEILIGVMEMIED